MTERHAHHHNNERRVAWAAFRIARRAPDWRHSFGFDRFQILVAFVNGLSLFAIAGWIIYEAIGRLFEPNEILGDTMLAIALAGLLVNIAAFVILAGAEEARGRPPSK